MDIKLYGTYMLGESQETVMCIGFDVDSDHIVFAPYYADDEDGTPELHVEDGVRVVNLGDVHEFYPLKPYKYEPKFRLTAELVGLADKN